MAQGTDKAKHPPGLYVLFSTEAAERFSFYTMRALLVLYLVQALGYNRENALSIYGTYLLLVYLSGLVGGYFADKVLGSRKAILTGGIVMGLGLFLMASQPLAFYGLGLIITGNGFFKPNISTIVSGLYDENDTRRDGAFTIFYMGINLGAFLAVFGAGYAESLAKDHPWGWNVGFVIAGVGMICSLALFVWGQKYLGKAGWQPGRPLDAQTHLIAGDWKDILTWAVSIVVVTLVAVASWTVIGPLWTPLPTLVKVLIGAAIIAAAGFGVRARSKSHPSGSEPLSKEEWQRVAAIIILSIFVIFFWAGFEQAGGTMNLFAFERTDRHVFGWEMPATWFQGFNPLFIFVLAPVFSMIWGYNDKQKWGLSTPGKMGWGMIVLGLGFIIMYFGQQAADAGGPTGQAGLMWLVMVYFMHTLGELCLSPIGLSMVTKLSPVRIVSLMMGVWFACTAIADKLSGSLEAIVHDFGLNLWAVLIASSIGAGCVLLALTPLLKKWMHGRA